MPLVEGDGDIGGGTFAETAQHPDHAEQHQQAESDRDVGRTNQGCELLLHGMLRTSGRTRPDE